MNDLYTCTCKGKEQAFPFKIKNNSTLERFTILYNK